MLLSWTIEKLDRLKDFVKIRKIKSIMAVKDWLKSRKILESSSKMAENEIWLIFGDKIEGSFFMFSDSTNILGKGLVRRVVIKDFKILDNRSMYYLILDSMIKIDETEPQDRYTKYFG